MLGDIQVYTEGAFGYPGDDAYAVASGTVGSIPAGTPVSKPLGSATVAAAADNQPVVGTDFFAGIASTTSTETATLAGTVRVTKMTEGTTYLISPTTVALWDTQAEYDALVGDRVQLDLIAGVWTIAAVDGATNGCVVMPLDIARNPGKVRFAFRNGVSYLA